MIKHYKWYSLLKDLETELFGDLVNLEVNKSLIHALWNRVTNYIEHSRNVLEYRTAPIPEMEAQKSSYYQDDTDLCFRNTINIQMLNIINCVPKQMCQNITATRQLTDSSQVLSTKQAGDYQKNKRLDYQRITKPWINTDFLLPKSEAVSQNDPDVVTSSLTNGYVCKAT